MMAVPAPALQVEHWLNTDQQVTLLHLRGRVVMLHAFQMLCPGCVQHGLPQAQRVFEYFPAAELAVLGLHTVFEHHAAMGRFALEVFVHEYRLKFPIGIDRADGERGIPKTMQAYELRGTPSLVLIDRVGNVRHTEFGAVSDLALGAAIATLIAERPPAERAA